VAPPASWRATSTSRRTGTQPNGGGAPWKDRTAALIAAQSRGWAADYLKGALEKRELTLDAAGIPSTIVDRYRHEIVYVNPVINGVSGFVHQNVGNGMLSPTWFGFHARVRTMVQILDSDIRTTAARAHVADYELWSAGRDGKFNAQRNHPHNRDNISIVRYNKELK